MLIKVLQIFYFEVKQNIFYKVCTSLKTNKNKARITVIVL